jgi:hypothetical protein
MPAGIPITGDDAAWKRKVDEIIAKYEQRIVVLENQINYLNQRVK